MQKEIDVPANVLLLRMLIHHWRPQKSMYQRDTDNVLDELLLEKDHISMPQRPTPGEAPEDEPNRGAQIRCLPLINLSAEVG